MLPFAVTGGTSYHVAIKVSGDTISASVNGTAAGSVTDGTYAQGGVGFREYGPNGEQATFDNVSVTAPDGTVLLSDDFSGGLGQWNPPPPIIASHLISTNSCGGQPSFIAPPIPGANGRPIYLYGSDLWDGSPNEALANYFWAPLRFGPGGAGTGSRPRPVKRHPATPTPIPAGRPPRAATAARPLPRSQVAT